MRAENLAALTIIGTIGIFAAKWGIPDSGKDIVLSVVATLGGFLSGYAVAKSS